MALRSFVKVQKDDSGRWKASGFEKGFFCAIKMNINIDEVGKNCPQILLNIAKGSEKLCDLTALFESEQMHSSTGRRQSRCRPLFYYAVLRLWSYEMLRTRRLPPVRRDQNGNDTLARA